MPEPQAFKSEPPRWARNVSGLAWAIVFYVLTFVLWQLLAWSLADAIEDRLLRAATPLLLANLLTNFILPRPAGIGACEGLGLRGQGHRWFFLAGVALAALGGAGIVLLMAAIGEIQIASSEAADPVWAVGNDAVTYLVTLVILALAALGEELFFRGYGFQQLGRALTPAGAALFTGMAFGFLHGRNPEVSEVAVANTVLFGILFGLCLVWSRSFWLPYGMHFGWNFVLATLGAPISGLKIKGTDLETVPVGGAFWDGGAYGPEGGLAATFLVVLFALAVWKLAGARTGGRLIWEDRPPDHGG